MERQLASLTGLVHKALTSSATSPRPEVIPGQTSGGSGSLAPPTPSPRLTPNQVSGSINQSSSPRLVTGSQSQLAPTPSPRLATTQQNGPHLQETSQGLTSSKSSDFLQVPLKISSGEKVSAYSQLHLADKSFENAADKTITSASNHGSFETSCSSGFVNSSEWPAIACNNSSNQSPKKTSNHALNHSSNHLSNPASNHSLKHLSSNPPPKHRNKRSNVLPSHASASSHTREVGTIDNKITKFPVKSPSGARIKTEADLNASASAMKAEKGVNLRPSQI